MGPEFFAAIIGVVGTLGAAWFAHWLQGRSRRPSGRRKATDPPAATTPQPRNATETTPEQRRYLDQPHHLRFIDSLPDLKAAVMANAKKAWDTGVTAEMRQANYDVVDFLKTTWLKLAEFYPSGYFDGTSHLHYIEDYLKHRFAYDWARHEPDGPGTGGTIVGVLTGGDVITELDDMVVDMVTTISQHTDRLNFAEWKTPTRALEQPGT